MALRQVGPQVLSPMYPYHELVQYVTHWEFLESANIRGDYGHTATQILVEGSAKLLVRQVCEQVLVEFLP